MSPRSLTPALLALAPLLWACGGGVSQRWYMEDARATAAAAAALRSVALGVSDYRSERGRPALCVGGTREYMATLRPLEARHARDAWLATLVRRAEGTAPVVAHGMECEEVGPGEVRVVEGEVPALLVVVAVTRIAGSTAWLTAQVRLRNNERFSYEIRVEEFGGHWETVDTWCVPARRAGTCVPIDPGITG